MELFRKPLTNITTIFITVLVSFGLVRLTNLSAEWQGIMLAVVATALFLIIQHVMQRPAHQPTVGPMAESTKNLFEKLKQQLVGMPARYFVYQPTSKCYVEIDSGQVLPESHPVILALGKKSTFTLTDLDAATIPDIYVEDITTLLTRFGQHLYAVTPSHYEQPLALVFTAQPLSDKQQTWLQHDFGTLLSLDLNQNFQLQGNATALTEERKYPVMLYVFIGLFVLFTAWFVWNDIISNVLIEATAVYGITALVGGLYGLYVSKQWKKLTNIGHGLRWLAIALLAQTFGQASYNYYYLFFPNVELYPSLGEVGYFGSELAFLIASIYIARSYGLGPTKLSVKEWIYFFSILVSLNLLMYVSFYKDYFVDWNHPIRVLLDFGYPIIDGFYVAIAVVTYFRAQLTQSTLSNMVLFIFFALVWQYLCNFIFNYQYYAGTWQPNGFNDYMYFLSYVWFGVMMVAFGKKIK